MDEQMMLEKYGEIGLANLKAHAELLNMPLDQLVSIADLAPVALLEMLQAAMIKKQRDDLYSSNKPSRLDDSQLG